MTSHIGLSNTNNGTNSLSVRIKKSPVRKITELSCISCISKRLLLTLNSVVAKIIFIDSFFGHRDGTENMKYLFIIVLLSISPATIADIQYMNDQIAEMKNIHDQKRLQEQDKQQQQTRDYLQQKQEQEQRDIRQYLERQGGDRNPINRLE